CARVRIAAPGSAYFFDYW
nr:immunoglobulin heavy chain junction region [Macaca mulatta]MOV39234.1 immunoglobulin heavy chain junction region [Macaca mulatta]MOV39519.1 immunoglobulin heavy chain junction region [Macaca mulatta]MOV44155.1 immunoglobulin heavy chain junction region [Macaca mulatta]MOV45399.1 immunoglobulin heavy chain junction region [Macaca mulatta]